MDDIVSKKTMEILKRVGAIITDSHFVLTSGRHSDSYVNKDFIYAFPAEVSEICRLMAERFKDKPIDVVVGPAMGGVLLAQWTAYHLSKLKGHVVHGVFTDKDSENNQVFKREYDKFVNGKNVLVVEDIATTGGSVRKSVDSVKNAGGNVLAVSIIVNRRPDHVTNEVVGASLFPLVSMQTKDFEEKECTWCKEGRPINTTVGHGKDFLAHKKA